MARLELARHTTVTELDGTPARQDGQLALGYRGRVSIVVPQGATRAPLMLGGDTEVVESYEAALEAAEAL